MRFAFLNQVEIVSTPDSKQIIQKMPLSLDGCILKFIEFGLFTSSLKQILSSDKNIFLIEFPQCDELIFHLFVSNGFNLFHVNCAKYAISTIEKFLSSLERDIIDLLQYIAATVVEAPILIIIDGFNTMLEYFHWEFTQSDEHRIRLDRYLSNFLSKISNKFDAQPFRVLFKTHPDAFLLRFKAIFPEFVSIDDRLTCDIFPWILSHLNLNAIEKMLSFQNHQITLSDLLVLAEKTRKVSDEKKLAKIIAGLTIPQVQWDDIGGLDMAKHQLIKTFSETRGIFQKRGVLLYGPPGTGKTMLAKAVATEFSLKFLSIKGPELLDSYVGESERNIREIFKKAQEVAPSLIFFDELDALAPSRSSSGSSSSSNVMHRMVSQLLVEIDNLSGPIFLLAATNRPDLIDSSLRRPGRFDVSIEFGVIRFCDDVVKILKALTRKFVLASQDFFVLLSSQILLPRSGADLYAICSTALLLAIQRNIFNARYKLIGQDQLLTRLVQQSPSFESLILNGLVSDQKDFLIPVLQYSDFIEAATSLKMLKGENTKCQVEY